MQDQNRKDTARAYSEQEQIRRRKLSDLCEAGNSPYQITRFDVTNRSAEIKGHFEQL